MRSTTLFAEGNLVLCPQADNDVDLRSNDVCNCVAKRCCVLRTQTQKERHDFHRVFLFVIRVRKRTGEKPLILLGSPRFSLRIYYNIKRHSLQHKNAESSFEIYNGNAKQTPAKLQPLSNNIFS